ncbi:hypothetical protein [Haloglomus litoreum]|uniref:hypothetical protein n=1 Tax=Haloglomus litoreum TaxID=3034026 RepID=UPI0023E8D628|nr:hypothetical protein [Haloglomus sp. DT116]
MKSAHMRRLLLGGTALLVAGWLGQVALVAPAILGAVALATLLPLTLVCSLYAVVLVTTRLVDGRGLPFRPAPPETDARGAEAPSSGTRRSTGGATEAD